MSIKGKMPSKMPAPPKTTKSAGTQAGKGAEKPQGKDTENNKYKDNSKALGRENMWNKLSHNQKGRPNARNFSATRSGISSMMMSVAYQKAETKENMLDRRIDKKENMEALKEDIAIDQDEAEDSAAKRNARSRGVTTNAKSDNTTLAMIAGATIAQTGAGGLKKASKKKPIKFQEQNVEGAEMEETFGFITNDMKTGDVIGKRLTTPGGHTIVFTDENSFHLVQADGEWDMIDLLDGKIRLDDWSGELEGDQQLKDLPISLVLDDGTKLTIGPEGEVAITNGKLFAQISNGKVERNNRSTLRKGLQDELVQRGMKPEEAEEKIEKAGKRISTLIPEDVNPDDLAKFNSADLDYIFRDGDYLVRNEDNRWLTNPSKSDVTVSAAAKDAMEEASLFQTMHRMQAFCDINEEILGEFIERYLQPQLASQNLATLS